MSSLWSWWPLLLAVAAYLAVMAAPSVKRHAPGSDRLLAVAWALHGVAVLAQMMGWGSSVPGWRFGFALALCVTLWFVVTVYLYESHLRLGPAHRRGLALIATVSLVLTGIFPGFLHDESVRAGSTLAPLHWLLGVASYGLFGVAVLHALWMRRMDSQLRRHGLPMDDDEEESGSASVGLGSGLVAPRRRLSLLDVERLTFRLVWAGFVVLTLALVIGVFGLNDWRWDHKVVLSTLSWLVFAGLLAGRHFLGWRGMQAIRWLFAGVLLLLMAYVGSRFVMQVLLHRPVV